jgi:hypothetical protein
MVRSNVGIMTMKTQSAILILALTHLAGCVSTSPNRIFTSIERGYSLYFAPDVVAYCEDNIKLTLTRTGPRHLCATVRNTGSLQLTAQRYRLKNCASENTWHALKATLPRVHEIRPFRYPNSW